MNKEWFQKFYFISQAVFEGKWPSTSTSFYRWRRMFHFISAVNYMLKCQERKRQVKTYLFDTLRPGASHSPGSVSTSNDSGIDDLDPYNSSPGRVRTISMTSSPSSSQTDLTNGLDKLPVTRSSSTISDCSDSSQCQLFINTVDDTDLGVEGYQVW